MQRAALRADVVQLVKNPERRVGRPSPYCRDFARHAYNLRLLGAPVEQIAQSLDINVDTFYYWIGKYPEFSDAIRDGAARADAYVAKKLYHRAIGYTHKAEKIFYDSKTERVVRAEYDEHYPPDTKAIEYWLNNRRPDLWKAASKADDNAPANQVPPTVTIQIVNMVKNE